MSIVWLYDQEEDAVYAMRSGDANVTRSDTDAGTAPMSGDVFVIEAADATAALDAARRWLANWADEESPKAPDDLMLVERGRARRRYMALRVL